MAEDGPRSPGIAPKPALAPGQIEFGKLQAAGFSGQELQEWQTVETRKLLAAGFTPREIDAHWGAAAPNAPRSQQAFNANLQANQPVVKRRGFMENLAAGWDMSVAGLIQQGKAPDEQTDPEGFAAIAGYTIGQLGGDIIPAIAGGVIGTFAGGGGGAAASAPTGGVAAPATVPIGAVIGAGAGSAMLPEAMRQTLIGAYRAGEVHSFGEWAQVVASGSFETVKQGVVGAVGNRVGAAAGSAVLNKGGGAIVARGADAAANTAASTAAMGAVNARVPTAEDFIAGTVVALGAEAGTMAGGKFVPTRASRRVEKNLQDIFVETGIPPWEAAAAAQSDPVWRQRVLAQDVEGRPVVPPTIRPAAPEPFRGDPTKMTPNPLPGDKPRALPERNRVPAMGHIENFMRIMPKVEGSDLKGGNTAISPAGARGRYQIMPGTARQYGFDPARLMDVEYNTKVARAIAADLYKRFNGDEEAMLVGYNAGPGRANRLMTAGPGTRLVATRDPKAPTGIRYHSEPSARDESFLPYETRKYLANARRHYGGELPGSRGGASSGTRPPEPGSMLAVRDGSEAVPASGGGGGGGSNVPMPEWATYRPEPGRGGDGGDGGDGPPNPPVARPDDPWSDRETADLYDELGKNIGEEVPSGLEVSPSKIIEKWFSELEPARQIDQDIIDAGKGYRRDRHLLTEDMFRQTYGSDNRASMFTTTGAVNAITLDVVQGSKSLMDAVQAVKESGGSIDEWMKWMVATRVVEKEGMGVKTGFNRDAAAELIKRQGEADKYSKATDIFKEVDRSVLEYGRDSGYFSQAQIDAMSNTAVHVSFRRMMGEDQVPLGGKKRGFRVSNVTKRMEGSDRQIVNPVLSTLDNIRLIVKMSDRNRAVGHVVNLVESGAVDIGVKKVGGAEVDAKDLAIYGLDPKADADTYAPALAKKAQSKLQSNQFLYMREGVPEVWEADSETVARLMRGAETQAEADVITKTAQFLASTMRAGIVNVAEFPVKNALVDQMRTFVLDPLHPPPFVTMIRGAFHVWGKGSDVYQDWIAKGGAGASMTQMDADYLARDMHRVFEDTGTFGSLWNAVQHPLEFAQIIQERIDAASRIGYYQHAVGKGIDPVKAATMSRKAYLDFAEKGTGFVTNYMAKVIPFYRTSMLGLKQVGESVKEKPIETAFYMTTIATAAAALYAMNYIQDEYGDLPENRKYKERERWEKDMLFMSPEIAGIRFKLRMPQPIAMIGGMTNRFLDHWLQKDPKAFDGWAKAMLKEMQVPIMPPAVSPILEQWGGKSFFTGKPLIPGSLEGASPQMQYTENTTEIAKALSRFIAPKTGLGLGEVSPIIIENYVRGWLGQIGYGVLKTLDTPFNPDPKPWELADVPFVSGFVTRNKKQNAASIQDFYDELDDFKVAAKNFSVAKKRVEEGGKFTELELAASDPAAFANFNNIAETLALQAQVIRVINKNEEMTVDERRQFIEQTYNDMISLSRAGLEGMRALKQMAKEAGAEVPPPVDLGEAPAQTQEAAPAGVGPALPAPGQPVSIPDVPVGASGAPGLGDPLKVLVN